MSLGIGSTQDALEPQGHRRSASRARRICRAVMAGVVAVSLSSTPIVTSGVARAEDRANDPAPDTSGTVGGTRYGEMTISLSPPTFGGVLCHSAWGEVQVYVVPRNVGTYWTDVQHYNTATAVSIRPGWVAAIDDPSVGVVGPDPARRRTQAVGSWLVYVQVGYFDGSGPFQTTYSQWVPSYANLLPGAGLHPDGDGQSDLRRRIGPRPVTPRAAAPLGASQAISW